MKVIVYKDKEGNIYTPTYNKDDTSFILDKDKISKTNMNYIADHLRDKLPWAVDVCTVIPSEVNPGFSVAYTKDYELTKELRSKIKSDLLKKIETGLMEENGVEGAREIVERIRKFNESLSDIIDECKTEQKPLNVVLEIDDGKCIYNAEILLKDFKIYSPKPDWICTTISGKGFAYYGDIDLADVSGLDFNVRDIKSIRLKKRNYLAF